jgi:hypothetical protein
MSKLNPELKKGDRIVLAYMDGETLGPGTKGEVLGISKTPSFGGKESYQYNVQWFDEDGNPISKLSLLPETDAWIYDKESNIENIQEIDFKNIDDLISKGDFLAVFSKKDLEKVYEFLELERQIGSHNMAMEGGKFLLMGPDYIRDFFKLQSYHIKPDKEKEILIKRLINRSEDIYNLFIRASMEYLDNKEIKYSLKDVQKTMVRLATTAKQFWMSEANKFLNKEIE